MSNLIEIFNKSIEYIEEKIKNSEEITNQDVAKVCGYEQHYCSKIFRKYSDMNIQEYIKKRKMTLAFYDLITSKEHISDIAEKYLYSADGFTKAFKDIFGITPIQLKRKEKVGHLIGNCMNPIFIEDYAQYIEEPKDFVIKETEEIKFIGVSDLDLLTENIQTIESNFEDIAIINENGKMFELSYYLDNEMKLKDTFYGNYYNPFGYYPEKFKIIKVPKQKWAIFNVEGIDKIITIEAVKSYFYNEWIKQHKEYERDDNYEISFECYGNELFDKENRIIRCEVWFPIRECKTKIGEVE